MDHIATIAGVWRGRGHVRASSSHSSLPAMNMKTSKKPVYTTYVSLRTNEQLGLED